LLSAVCGGADILDGGLGSNTIVITGNEQDNALVPHGGVDILNGGTGNDSYGLNEPLPFSVRIFDESGTADKLFVDSFTALSRRKSATI
jgi:Ca2+-binding RTX toxin-like protein